MQYANIETLEQVTEFDIRQSAYPSCLPAELTPELLSELGFALIETAEQPELQPGETLHAGELQRDGDRVIRPWIVVPTPAMDWPSIISARRYAAEIGGIEIDGMHVDTDDRSKTLIAGAAVETMLDPEYSMQWKTPAGFIDLSAQQIIVVARAVRAHVQSCFDREADLLAALADGTITAELIKEGWPGEPIPEAAAG